MNFSIDYRGSESVGVKSGSWEKGQAKVKVTCSNQGLGSDLIIRYSLVYRF